MIIYSKEVRKKLDDILSAFADYIDSQNYFDIVYSKKVGYLWIVIDPPGGAGAEQLDTPEDMLDHFFNDIINDVVAPRESISLTEAHTLTESEETEVRRRVSAILKTIEGGADEYFDYLDEYIQDYQEHYSTIDE